VSVDYMLQNRLFRLSEKEYFALIPPFWVVDHRAKVVDIRSLES